MLKIGRQLQHSYRARLYFALVLATFLYVFGYSQSLIQYSIAGADFWSRFQYAGVSFLPVSLSMLTFHTAYYPENKSFPRWFLLLLLPAFIILLSQWSYPYAHIYYSGKEYLENGPFLLVGRVYPGFGWYLNTAHVVLGFVLSAGFAVHAIRRYRGMIRKDLILMLTGIIVLALAYFGNLIFVDAAARQDPIPIVISLVSPLFAAGIFADRLINDLSHAKTYYFDTSSSPVLIFNREHLLIDMNLAACTLFSISKHNAIGQSWNSLLSSQKESEVIIRDNGRATIKELLLNGRIYAYNTTVFKDQSGVRRGTLRSLLDMTEQHAAMKILEQEASIDGLTGLLNRKHWENKVRIAIKQGIRFSHPGSLILLDLDNFKQVNDTYGHLAGDTVLREVSSRLKYNMREIDIIGRYGGEEISIWLSETSQDKACVAAEKLRRLICDKSVLYGNQEIQVTASIGLHGESPLVTGNVYDIIKVADHMLYRAKDRGKNRIVCSQNEQGKSALT
ncbi:hypothetical protein JCM12856_14910 [Spirochaeta dissipatitropha]